MESLAEQELREANGYLVLFEKAHHLYTLFIGGSLISAAVLPLILLVHWLLGYESIIRSSVGWAELAKPNTTPHIIATRPP